MADSAISSMSESGEMESASDYASSTEDIRNVNQSKIKETKCMSSESVKEAVQPSTKNKSSDNGADIRNANGLQSSVSVGLATENEMRKHCCHELERTLESLRLENSVLKMKIENLQSRCDHLQQEKKLLLKDKLNSYASAEQNEENRFNKMTKKIYDMRKEKEELAVKMEQEEEHLINDLNRKMFHLRQEKEECEKAMAEEHNSKVCELQKRIVALENETSAKQSFVEQLRKEKVDLENELEQEQERLLNHLRRRILKLEDEKHELMKRVRSEKSGGVGGGGRSSRSSSTSSVGDGSGSGPTASSSSNVKDMTEHIQEMRSEVRRLRTELTTTEAANFEKISSLTNEEKQLRAENIRLQRKLQLETERREALCRALSESESSLEMEDERHFNEMHHITVAAAAAAGAATIPVHSSSSSGCVSVSVRPRTGSSPITRSSPIPLAQSPNRSVSPAGGGVARSAEQTSPVSRCPSCGSMLQHTVGVGLPLQHHPPMGHASWGPGGMSHPTPDVLLRAAVPTGCHHEWDSDMLHQPSAGASGNTTRVRRLSHK